MSEAGEDLLETVFSGLNLWLFEQDLDSIQHGWRTRVLKALPLDEELLEVIVFCGRKNNQFYLGIWPLIGWPWSKVWAHTPARVGITNWTQWVPGGV